jgi:hypothetical protein
MFLGSAAFAEETFADLLEFITPPPIGTIVGGFSKGKKKYNNYTIFGKTYQLTEKEYQLYLAQRKAFEDSIKNKTDDELYDIVESSVKKHSTTKLFDLIRKPIIEINKLDIPLSNIKFDDKFEKIALQRIEAIKQEKKRLFNIKLDQDEEDLAMIMMFMM